MKIVMGCFEAPGYGGASTSNYLQFQQLQNLGADISWINLFPLEKMEFLTRSYGPELGNPARLKNVYNCVLGSERYGEQKGLRRLLRELSPDVQVGCHFLAAKHFARENPECPTVFVTAGFYWTQQLVPAVFPDAVSLMTALKKHGHEDLPPVFPPQDEAFKSCGLCIANSSMIADFYGLLYPDSVAKIHPEICWSASRKLAETEAFSHLSREFEARDIDYLFLSSRWDRELKNYALVCQLIDRFPSARCFLAGICDEPHPAATNLGFLVTREDVYEAMGRSKTVVSTSSWDAAPGILWEAHGMGCNIVTSKNCGNWEICHPELLVGEYSTEGYVVAMQESLKKRYPSQIERFLHHTPEHFLGILEAFYTKNPAVSQRGGSMPLASPHS